MARILVSTAGFRVYNRDAYQASDGECMNHANLIEES